MLPVLIVEDQPAVARALEVVLELHGLSVRVARGPREALLALADGPWGVVLQDMNFSPGATTGDEGAELFREIRRREPGLPVVLLTAWTSIEAAVTLTREGASDYLAKPWDDRVLVARIEGLLAARQPAYDATSATRHELGRHHDLCGLVWRDPAMGSVVELALRAARTDHPVLITGASGVGKEKIAELIHANSSRASRTFLRVHAGALPAQLLEAELFGVEAGAFTGAVRRSGRFEAADRGTLLLDEIGTLPLAGQAKLLRVLQSGELERLGSSTPRRVDVRMLSATNEDLEAEVAAGRFRADLYWRLAVVRIAVPPLVDRPADVAALAEHFLAQLPPAPSGHRWVLSEGAVSAMLAHGWPGNVRELESVLRQATLSAPGPELSAHDLGLRPASGCAQPPNPTPGRRETEAALRAAGGVVAHAAAHLGISRQALYRRMERYGLSVHRTIQR